MYNKNNPNYKRYLAGIITESQYFDIIEAEAAGAVPAPGAAPTQPGAAPAPGAAPTQPGAAPASEAIPQEKLAELYPRGKTLTFVKNVPVALIKYEQLKTIADPKQLEAIISALGGVDKTSYSEEDLNKGYIVFQWNNNKPDIYVADDNTVAQKYTKFQGDVPNPKKVPSFTALAHFGIDPNKMPLYKKMVPTQMIKASDVGIENQRIKTKWDSGKAEQDVAPGGYLVREDDGHIYTVAPDQQGLPIGYAPFK